QRIQQLQKILQRKSPVLEKAKHPEVADEADHQQQPLLVDIGLGVQGPAHKIVHHRRQPKQQDEWRVPGRIKDVAGQQQIDLLHLPGKGKVVQQKHKPEEENKNVGIENHIGV